MELEEICTELIGWERFFAGDEAARDELFALDSPEACVGISRAGLCLTRFVCRLETGRLSFDCTCVTSCEDLGGGDSPGWPGALATVRLAILLANAEREGREWLPNDPLATVRVESDETGVSFSVRDAEGAVCAAEDGWDGLVRILDRQQEIGESQIWA